MGRLLPICKPTPLAADDMHERVSHGTKAAAQIARELLSAESGDCSQNPVVCPAIVFVEQLNVILSHGEEWQDRSSGESYLSPGIRQNASCGPLWNFRDCPESWKAPHRRLLHGPSTPATGPILRQSRAGPSVGTVEDCFRVGGMGLIDTPTWKELVNRAPSLT